MDMCDAIVQMYSSQEKYARPFEYTILTPVPPDSLYNPISSRLDDVTFHFSSFCPSHNSNSFRISCGSVLGYFLLMSRNSVQANLCLMKNTTKF